MKLRNAGCPWRRFCHVVPAMMAFIALSIFTAPPCFCGDPCSEIDLSAISKILKGDSLSGASIVSQEPIKDLGLCEVILKTQTGQYLPCYVSRNSLILGHLYKDGQNISQNKVTQIRKSVFLSLDSKLNRVVAFIYRPRVTKTNVYMITDPLCPYCHKVESRIKELANKYNAQINVILYSVHGPYGEKKCVEAVCRNFTLDDYQKNNWRKRNTDDYQCEKGDLLIENAKKVIHKIGISGVPTFILDDGRSVSGANLTALTKLLTASQDRENPRKD
ncbi:MAG: thioredoxin fold domain-containing protein [Deltaproteobacteria bacterium]|nr:thioredoxin fold domain-containing protein [Deltaproteobacteria bacterium]MBW2330195.1 thioredoxin fold domain-containing protein [Deltaproteobacteria bacterium]